MLSPGKPERLPHAVADGHGGTEHIIPATRDHAPRVPSQRIGRTQSVALVPEFPLVIDDVHTSSMRASDWVYQACLIPSWPYCPMTERPSRRKRVVP